MHSACPLADENLRMLESSDPPVVSGEAPDPGSLALRLKRLEQELSAAGEAIARTDLIRRHGLLLQAFMDRSDLLAWLKDERGRLVWANRLWFEQFGFVEADTLDRTDFELFPDEEAKRMRALDLEVLGGHDPVRGIEKTVDADGSERCWRVTRFPFHDATGVRYVGGIADDDTALVHQHEEAHRQSITDSLTGLLNRRGFDALAEPELLRARRRGSCCTLVFIDLDGLKGVNERLGHAAGDAMIALASMILRKTFRTTDIVARIGGDEFAIFAPDTDGEVDSIRRRLRGAVDELSANPILKSQFGFSVGLIRCDPADSESLAQMLERADQLTYAEKQAKKV